MADNYDDQIPLFRFEMSIFEQTIPRSITFIDNQWKSDEAFGIFESRIFIQMYFEFPFSEVQM